MADTGQVKTLLPRGKGGGYLNFVQDVPPANDLTMLVLRRV
jgi:hypothetical protein